MIPGFDHFCEIEPHVFAVILEFWHYVNLFLLFDMLPRFSCKYFGEYMFTGIVSHSF